MNEELDLKPCAICGSSSRCIEYLRVYCERTKRIERLLRCRGCGLVYVDEPLRQNRALEQTEGQSLIESWEGQFPDSLDVHSETSWASRFQDTEVVLETQLRTVEELVGDRLREPGCTLLELGPGRGYLLAKIAEKYPGAKLLAIEPSPVMAEVVKKSGAKVFNGILETAGLERHSLDAIIAFGSFIQIRDPRAALQILNGALKNGGRFLFDSPNDNSVFRWLARMSKSIDLAKLPRGWSRQIESLVQRAYNPGRFYYYTERTYSKLVALAGLEVTDSLQRQARFVTFGKADLPILVRSAMKGVSLMERILSRQSWIEVRGIKVRDLGQAQITA